MNFMLYVSHIWRRFNRVLAGRKLLHLKVVAVVITDDRKGDGGQLKNLIGQVTGSSEMEDACKADGSSKEGAPEVNGKPVEFPSP